ncbi:pyrimidine/purine nucleoside phosphorylase [Enterococcus malodoratus]|uniref:pyrimidine/purine nucleoside phosphorylase n=1 Tax=Enterococcus malodoratus TaxID=71451 RepID=UPI0039AFA254
MFENAKVEAKANIYFDGKVTSRTLHLENGEAVTLGFMLEGSYTFNTQKKEIMKVTQGAMTVLLPNEESWKTVSENEEFIVPANSAFLVKIEKYADYTCYYVTED